MKFLNKKEQVIDLEVTPYGKSLLARGRFKPEFYAFYDSDILYDGEYGGVLEHQNSSSVRIKEVPQLETQAYFYGAESQVKLATEYHRLTEEEKRIAKGVGQVPMDINTKPYVADDDVTIQTIPDREFNGVPLGKSKLNSSYAPAWDVKVLQGEISSSTDALPNWSNVQRIPQLNIKDITYTIKLSDEIESDNYYEFLDSNGPELNGKFLNVIEDSIILEIDEENTEFEWENFELEVFAVETKIYSGSLAGTSDDVTKEFLMPLFFSETPSFVKDGILYEPGEMPIKNSVVDPNYTEYYFDILVDKEIDQKKLCGVQPLDKAQGIFSKRMLECSELEDQEEIDIENLYDGDNFEDECD